MHVLTINPAVEPLKLTNNGKLELFFLGVGSAFAAKNYQSNLLIIKGETHILVDFGMTGPTALEKTAGLKPTDIRIVLPTHSHADHVGGIECLGLMNRYVGQRFMKHPKTQMIITPEYQRILWDQTLRGGMEWNEDPKGDGRKLSMGDFFDIIVPKWKTHQPREIFEIEVGDIRLEMFRTTHIPEQSVNWEASFISYGLFIDGRIFFSGDTKFDPALIELYADRSEMMFHDVQFFPGAVHAPLANLHTLPGEIKSKMLLHHYADNYQDQNIEGFAGYAQQGVQYFF